MKNILGILRYSQGEKGWDAHRKSKQQETLKSSEVLGRRCASPTSKEENPALSISDKEKDSTPWCVLFHEKLQSA